MANSQLQNIGSHMPVIGPPGVCAVCSQVFSAQHRRGKTGKGRNRKAFTTLQSSVSCGFCAINFCLHSNNNCWVGWHTQASFCYNINKVKCFLHWFNKVILFIISLLKKLFRAFLLSNHWRNAEAMLRVTAG